MGQYVVVNDKGQTNNAAYDTLRGARGAATRLNNRSGPVTWRAMTRTEWIALPVKMVERTNFMTGEKFMEAENTPYYCSPSSETYWST